MHPNDGRVVSSFIVQALTSRNLTVFGEGQQTRSFCYVDDLIDGLVKLMTSGDDIAGPLNLGNPRETTVRELAETIINLTGSGSKVVYRPLPQDDPRQRRPDISQAGRELDWQPKVLLKEGLERTIAYFDNLLSGGVVRERILQF
jgi:UDP-glucuronate decarboxylase